MPGLVMAGLISVISAMPLRQNASAHADEVIEDKLTSRLFFGSTGRSLRAGDAYLAIIGILVPVVHAGVTDRFSIGVGKPFYIFSRDFFLTPKYQVYRSERTNAAVGVLHFILPGYGSGGIAYLAATRGLPDAAGTFGVGWSYARGKDNGIGGGGPVFVIGGEVRTGRRVKFITENFVVPGGALVSAGARIMRKRFATELGVTSFIASDTVLPGLVLNLIWIGSK